MHDPKSATLPFHLLHPQQHDGMPRPPFSASFRDYLIVGLVWNRSDLRALIPEELDLPETVTGFIATGRAASCWGVPPFSNFYLAVAVDGLPSTDGTPGHFRPLNLYSPKAAHIFRHHYNVLMDDADHSHRFQGNRHLAEIRGGGLEIRLAVRAASVPGQPTTGVHHYMGRDAMGEITSFHASFTADFAPAEVETLEISGPEASRLPVGQIQWATHFSRLDVTIGEPRGSPFAEVAGGPGAAALTSLLSRIGLAAACLGDQGQILSANAAARAILRDVSPRDLVRLANAGRMQAMNRVQTGLPVIAQVVALDQDLLNRPACLVLFRDPVVPQVGDATAVLELLGLTPAEARLAASVGSGIGPAEAAERLGITTNTARTTLQTVYGKLQIGRQSELARIVAQIATGGGSSRMVSDI